MKKFTRKELEEKSFQEVFDIYFEIAGWYLGTSNHNKEYYIDQILTKQ